MIYIFLISLLVLQTLVVTECLTLNVRTTLFTPSDLARKNWNKRDVGLLKARMYFQGLLPPMEVSQSPEYVRSLIRYIENCYSSVNREAFDSETGSILTAAVSDVLGGYLKMVALPVAKSAYYNGELPTQDALKLFKYYDDIKEQLGTNGKGWSEQLTNVVKTKNVRGTRSNSSLMKIKNPCQRLYLQNNKQNLTMPIPSIDWKKRMMFVPLTDQPIVDLRSPDISRVLQQFHQIATACERSIYPEHRYFQGSFEDWVNEAVLPHLSDEDLYTAFKGILCLIEKDDLMSVPDKCKGGIQFIKDFFLRTSRKTIIIVIILTLECICCIPTLLYCVQKKKKSNKKSRSEPPSSGSASECDSPSTRVGCNDKSVFYELSSRGSSFNCPSKLNSKVNFSNYNKFTTNEANSDLSTASVSRRSYSSITDAVTAVDEAITKKYYNKDKKVPPRSQQLLHYKQTETDEIHVSQHQTQVSKWPLSRTNSTSTAINLNIRTSSKNDTSNDTGETITLSTVLPQDKSCSKVLRKSKRFKARYTSPRKIELLKPETYNPFPSSRNVKSHEKSNAPNTVQELKRELFDDRLSDIANLMRYDNGKNADFASPHVGAKASTKKSETRCNRSLKSYQSVSTKSSVRIFKVLDENKMQMAETQDLTKEAKIDRIRQSINAKVSKHEMPMDSEVPKIRKGILKAGEGKTKVKTKTSRIPKKTSSPGPPRDVPRAVRQEPVSPRRKSRIPKLERALDDSAIHSATPRDGKLNVTL